MKIALVTCERLPQGVAEDQPLFQALKDAHIEFQVCIWNKDTDWSQFDLCLLRSVWDYHEKSDAFMQWMHETSQVTQVFNPVEVVEWNRNKNYLKELCDFGLPVAPTVWLAQGTNKNLINEMAKLPPSQQYFLKPTIGADSSGTFRFDDSLLHEAQAHFTSWTSKQDMMLQSYLPSVEHYGEVSAIYFGGQFSHAIRKIPVNGDYRVQDTYGGKDILHTLNTEELSVTEATNAFVNQKFGALCYARIDLLVGNDNQAYINELELIEPSLFFNHARQSASDLATLLKNADKHE